MMTEAMKLEDTHGPILHAVRLSFSGSKLEAEFIFNRDRGGSYAIEGGDGADQAPRWGEASDMDVEPASGKRQANANKRQPKQAISQNSGDSRGRGKGAATSPAPAPAPASNTCGADKVPKDRAVAAVATIKAHITQVVRAQGGDEKTGAEYLTPQAVTIQIGAHKAKFKFPKGSEAADTPAPQIGRSIYEYLAGGGDTATLDEATKRFLTPRAATDGRAAHPGQGETAGSAGSLLAEGGSSAALASSPPAPLHGTGG